MLRLPSPRPSPWRLRDSYLDGLSGLLGCAGAVLAGIKTYANPAERGWAVAALALTMLIVGLTIVRTRRSVAKERKYEPPQEPKEIAGWARGCYDLVNNARDGSAPLTAGDVRLTVYRVEYDSLGRNPTELEQLVEYVGGAGGGPGRKLPVRSGLIGACARGGETLTADRQSEDLEGFREEMVRHWGYTKDEARQLSPDRQSFFALPIRESEDGPVVAVVYLDSKVKGIFDVEEIQRALVGQCGVLTQILRRCYS